AGMPPKIPEAIEARPCPTSSLSPSYGPVSEIDAATRADSNDSIAASAATVNAAPTSDTIVVISAEGSAGAGSEPGSVPILASGRSARFATTATSTIAMRDPGNCGWMRGATSITSTTISTAATGQATLAQSMSSNACTAATNAPVLGRGSVPTAAGTCWRKMITAIPSVKPSMTGQGMYETTLPSFRIPPSTTITPAMRLTSATVPAPWAATTGPSTTTIAPVGPDTWMFDPPKTAAITPATIAVMSPLSAPAPELTPNARASGSATIPTVMPATTSPRHVRRTER